MKREAKRTADVVKIIADLEPSDEVVVNTDRVRSSVMGEVVDVMTNTPGTRNRARKVSTTLDVPEEASYVATADIMADSRKRWTLVGMRFGGWSYAMITDGSSGEADTIMRMGVD